MTKVGNTSILGITMNKFFLGNYLILILKSSKLSQPHKFTPLPKPFKYFQFDFLSLFHLSLSLSLSPISTPSRSSLLSRVSLLYLENRILFPPPRRASEMEKLKMEVGSGSGSSLSQRSRQFSCLRLCHCGLPAKIRQAWTDKNPGRHFHGCPRFKV